MAYYGYEFTYADRAAFWSAIQTALINMGWELWDTISATVKVYRSNGESGQEPYGYIWIDAGTSTYIEFRAYQYWNNATHAGVRLRYAVDTSAGSRITATNLVNTVPGLILGDKNLVLINGVANIITNGTGIMFGHVPVRLDNFITPAVGTAGTAGTITIASSSGQGIGKNIQIAGEEGCDSLLITASPDAVTRRVTALPRNYGTSARIGAPASVFGITTTYSPSFYPVSTWGDSGVTVSTNVWTIAALANPGLYNYLSYSQKKYLLTPFFIWYNSASNPGASIGLLGNNLVSPYNPVAMGGMLLNNDNSFPFISMITGHLDNTLSDSTQSWAVNQHAGRFCIISDGGGAGAAKKILSNTSDTLTLDSSWHPYYMPGGGSIYRIADVFYRALPSLFLINGCGRVTDTVVS
jgi:hypothetical protein